MESRRLPRQVNGAAKQSLVGVMSRSSQRSIHMC